MPNLTLFSIKDWDRVDKGKHPAIKRKLINVYKEIVIYKRFDALVDLVDCCDVVIKNNASSTSDKLDITYIKDLKKIATTYLQIIVDAKDETDLQNKIELRKKYKKVDSNYMPWNKPSTQLNPDKFTNKAPYLWQKLVNSNNKKNKFIVVNPIAQTHDPEVGVQYFNEIEREYFRIFPYQGTFKKIEFDFKNLRHIITDFDTQNNSAHDEDEQNKSIFVISNNGDIFAGNTEPDRIHHSSFLAGGKAFFAGNLSVTKGKLRYFDDCSGHYQPKVQHSVQLINYFRKAGLLNYHPHCTIRDINEDRSVFRKIRSENYFQSISLNALPIDLDQVVLQTNDYPSEKHDIAEEDHYAITKAIYKYIASRTKSVASLELNMSTKLFHNADLSKAKVLTANQFLNDVYVTRDYFKLKQLLNNFSDQQKQNEKNAGKIFSIKIDQTIFLVSDIRTILKKYIRLEEPAAHRVNKR